ncbi:hypothetical protein BHM03_00030950 [Ensete ventricosum]|nr:hypothetical protein BHM03_00030950 [Ensete ventricosum]
MDRSLAGSVHTKCTNVSTHNTFICTEEGRGRRRRRGRKRKEEEEPMEDEEDKAEEEERRWSCTGWGDEQLSGFGNLSNWYGLVNGEVH